MLPLLNGDMLDYEHDQKAFLGVFMLQNVAIQQVEACEKHMQAGLWRQLRGLHVVSGELRGLPFVKHGCAFTF